MIDQFKMNKFTFVIIWLILAAGYLTQSTKLNDQTLTTTPYQDDNQLVNTIGNDDCGCLTNFEIKISNDAMYTGQLIRCTNVKQFNHLNLITRLTIATKCSQAEQQFNEM